MISLLTRSVLCRDALMSRMQEHMSVMMLHLPLNSGWHKCTSIRGGCGCDIE